MTKHTLAIDGGKPVRQMPLPPRRVFGESELEMVKSVFKNSWESGIDFGFQGKFEEQFTKKFCEFQGGAGFADAVSSGSAAVYIALKALDIEPRSDVIVSPVTNPGGIMPIAVQNINLVIPDSEPNSFNISPKKFEEAITPKTTAAVLTHLGGHTIDLDPIIEIAKSKKIKIVEDCAQAHGATYKGKRVGTFTEIAAFSNGFSKTLAAGGVSGIVYTKNKDLYWRMRSFADRGKPFHKPDFNFRITTDFLFPSHNFNADEISCAIGTSVLSKLQNIIDRRHEIANKIDLGLKASSVVYPANLELPGSKSSIFFHTVVVDIDKLKVSKVQFANAIAAEGIMINTDYRDIVCEWQWIPEYVKEYKKTPNSINFRDRTFNILFHEQFGDAEVKDIIESILKVEEFYSK
jgi:dTDP-4-amino-4,6-dideoxygalactose transaminase|tara:strand:- start:413 stop:1627 length:1215 start_codon:yes stop_codon:yes gene_type:complete